MMKATMTKWIALSALSGAAFLGTGRLAMAQTTAPSTRFSVDLKDATLRDAIELVFQAAGNPSHVIDPAASQVRIGSVSFKDQEWRDIVRSLANLNKFSFRRENGLWVVAPRAVNSSTRIAPFFQIATMRSASMHDFSVETRSSRQTNTGGGTGGGGTGGGTGSATTLTKPPAVDSNNPWSIIEPLHIYAGAIALFFQGGTVATTESFIVPAVAFSTHLGGNLLNRPGYVRGSTGGGTSTNNSSGSGGSGTGTSR